MQKILKVFIKDNCVNCKSQEFLNFLKQKEKEGYKIEKYNIDTNDGIAEMALYGIVKYSTPIVYDEFTNKVIYD